jgi:hypothetical protein
MAAINASISASDKVSGALRPMRGDSMFERIVCAIIFKNQVGKKLLSPEITRA